MNQEFYVGNHVVKVGGDYTFEGIVVAAFTKLFKRNAEPPPWRYVVQDDRGVLHIYSGKNLKLYVYPTTIIN